MKPEVGASSSPVLFPAVGTVKEAMVLHKGHPYALPKHGIIRNHEHLEVEQISDSHIAFRLESSEATKEQYPIDFQFAVHYELQGKSLRMRFEIENRGQEDLFFNAGGHTAYYCPLDNAQLEDYQIELPRVIGLKAQTIDPKTMLLGYSERDIYLDNGSLVLSPKSFSQDALIFENVDFKKVRLKQRNGSRALTVKFEGFPYLALWAKPAADYVCIEPWLGLPDRVDAPLEISRKPNYTKLPAGESQSLLIETFLEG